MKHLLLIATTLLISNTVFAQTFSLDKETYDCDYAGTAAEYATKLKSDGMTFEELQSLAVNIPDSQMKNMFLYYSHVGFQSNTIKRSYETGYRLCKFNRS